MKDKTPLIHCKHCGMQTWIDSLLSCGACANTKLDPRRPTTIRLDIPPLTDADLKMLDMHEDMHLRLHESGREKGIW